MKILLSKPSIPKLFAKQHGWQRALVTLFISKSNAVSTAKRHSVDLDLSSSLTGQFRTRPQPVSRQRSYSTGTQNDVEFDCSDEVDDFPVASSPPKYTFGDFLSDPYSSQRRLSSEDDFDALVGSRGIMKSMRSASCTSNLSQVSNVIIVV